MDVFKLRVSDIHGITISRETFEHETKQQAPWYQSLDGRNESHLAVCPACDNTISIIGLHSSDTEINEETGEIQAKKSTPAHGRHYLYKQLDGLGILDREAYENCPYSQNTKLSPTKIHSDRSRIPSKVLTLLSTDFDRVVHLLSKSIGIGISNNQAMEMATRYKQSEGWKYAGATVMNIPWIFGYFSRSTTLMFKSISNEKIRDAVQQHYPCAKFEGKYNTLKRTTKHINPCFCFEKHTRKTVNEHLIETIDLVLSDDDGIEFYREAIEFDPAYFANLINKKEATYRNEVLIEFGKSHFQVTR
ncbi:hypothetical protein SO574_23450 (plasmid) [Vibrio alfacsensis]|uniref:hypothetical protein n=1 Tax=Vibrio alfacsensis TaxID=1074311 RepID=UPI002ADD9FD4|nr:hypothetical protein [Vibrio alfacsensis]WQE79497.1 hypothetical protein SO574_23450 [Vibrio alfacsensis]